ncbi:Protein CBG04461 [Caenorhabditis briggsae]|uniref:Protein CBG04461 n=1 Tax=Caenorhabditis briggsae TaxID=6238 RepID=A8WXM2_CAEBR|nr:Protein CBG04461 [Caenorhabditis briggsae]CAP25157.1 Protein CBG04461 [Caenorhabditis briggsae]
MISIPTQNVIQLAAGFLINFVAFNTQGFIEESVINSVSRNGSINKHAGYYSLAIIYALYTLGNLTAAQIVDVLTPKWAMCIGALCYGSFQVGFLFLNSTYLYVTSAVLGFGASILWTGQGSYLSQNCTKETTGRMSALLWAIHECCLIGGGIMIFVVFTLTASHDVIPNFSIKLLYSIFTVLSIMAAIVFSLLREPVYKKEKQSCYKKLMTSTFRLMITKKMWLLAVIFSYAGIEQAFWTGIYPTCVSFTRQLAYNTNALLALNLICVGVGQVSAGLLLGILGGKARKLGRDYLILIATLIHVLAYILCGLNFPSNASLVKTDDFGLLWTPNIYVALANGVMLGFADCCWNTQIMSLLCETYPEKCAQAFAIFKFYESALSCATFIFSSLVSLHWLLATLATFSILALISFFIVEREHTETTPSESVEIENRI